MTTLTGYNCTIRIFDVESGVKLEEHVLSVDSPDAAHTAASTLANACSFTIKTNPDGSVKPVSFCCTKAEKRN